MFRHKFELPLLRDGHRSEKHPVVSIMPHADDDSAVADHPSATEKAPPQGFNLLGDLRDAALNSTLVAGAKDLRDSTKRELDTIGAIVKKDGSSRDEKLRTLLHHLVRSRREAELYNDFADTAATEDSDLLLSSFAAQVNEISVPLRMFDLDTMNMVDTGYFNEEDHYCMLSHSWKGGEVDYALVCEAQRDETAPGSNDSDVTAVLNLCNSKIKKIAGRLVTLLQEGSAPGQPIRKLLEKSLEAASLERNLNQKKRERTIGVTNKRQSDLEENNYQKLLDFLGEMRIINSLEKRKGEAQEQERKALEACASAESSYEASKSEMGSFRSDRKLSYAIDDLSKALQQRRSARKLEKSIQRAKEVYDTRPFSKTGRRYIWLDNCCIDKRQAAELSESLARMGEWYANADFCLVHLDTNWDNNEWLDEWDSWYESQPEESRVVDGTANSDHSEDDQKGVSADQAATPRRQPVAQFEDIQDWKPVWATRGWTLQELVLSKMTFYVNADWKWLSRPIDVLGTYYHFCPFVDFYTRSLHHVQNWEQRDIGADLDEVNASMNSEDIEWEEETTTATEGINVKSIIGALELFNFVVPKQLEKETARARISYSVQVAVKATIDQSTDEASEYRKAIDLIIETIFADVPYEQLYVGVSREKRVKQTIDRILGALAKATNELIRQDRRSIAKFSNVEGLSTWADGTERDRFSAHSVMMLASHRECTKPIDKAYSLMGVLGVQFPSFHAEGLTKALSRLLDEVVITSHDVSVFNWTGKYNGSPLRGRSLYSSNITAFQTEGERDQARPDVDGEVVRFFRANRLKLNKVARGVTKLLREAIEFVTVFRPEEAMVNVLLELVQFVRDHDLKTLQSWLGSPELVAALARAGEFAQAKTKKEKEQKQKQKQDLPKDQGRSWGKFTAPLPALSKVPTWREDRADDDDTNNEELGSLGQTIQDIVPQALRGDLRCADENNAFLAAELEPRPHTMKNITRSDARDRPIICPNPIVINSSGIKGVFDIQRVVVKLLLPDELRTKVRNAASDDEKIDGWCTISTGFALTMVAFSCERHILSKQLDLGDVIDRTVLDEPDTQDRELNTPKQNSAPGDASNETPNTEGTPSGANGGTPTDKPRSSMQDADSSGNGTPPKLDNYGRTLEQRKVSRMIDFVTEANLHAIAGEWVLARFSGAIGAKWFLCRLELGSGNEYYARRIATDELNFANAIPEKGLVEFWDTFLHDKWITMCDILKHHLDARKAGNYASWLHDNLMGTSDSSESSDDEDETNQNSIKYGGLTSTGKFFKMVGWGLRSAFDEIWAQHLDKHLEEKALAKVPPILHAAIKDLDADEDLFPVMFHSGRDVHFF
ncbi:uncharacterized protein BO80DRAFT_238125 [Aspergillus ibericus CBS 121593]|uniref:Heterokaryon incompatibility domain-containing protein n=1 Tax=Aspergillus ibericus CBS 121593 TaxID=1448316 RepID=A0A395GLF7_9EURO|nr:hypothetical protein BO80DRAFT_238125 [Aspergillus ibericus CBS 121593]RAK96224.1 hypothetical protein BO80DRAFT_238125 [Aspergillus ibericus CBS 121593]